MWRVRVRESSEAAWLWTEEICTTAREAQDLADDIQAGKTVPLLTATQQRIAWGPPLTDEYSIVPAADIGYVVMA